MNHNDIQILSHKLLDIAQALVGIVDAMAPPSSRSVSQALPHSGPIGEQPQSLRLLRMQAQMTQVEMAQCLGTTSQSISRYERGEHTGELLKLKHTLLQEMREVLSLEEYSAAVRVLCTATTLKERVGMMTAFASGSREAISNLDISLTKDRLEHQDEQKES